MKRILPTWCKEVKKSMIDDDINVTELAERVGFSRNYVSGVVNGRVYAPEIAKVSVSITARARRGGKTSCVAHMCKSCFVSWCEEHEVSVPDIDGLEKNKIKE